MDVPVECDLDDRLCVLHSAMFDFFHPFHSTHSKSDFEEKINKISGWVDEQKKVNSSGTENKEDIENVGKALTSATRAIQRLKSEDHFEITSSTLDLVSSVAVFHFGPDGSAATKAFCSIIGAILSANKPSKPSVVEQLANAVHSELVNSNRKLQDQRFSGLKYRISGQKDQLQKMSRGEKLDDPNLWNDYAQFLGELSERFESPLTFKYNENLSKDADVADFVTAVVMYCQAHTCFLALLTAAKGRFEDLGDRKDEKDMIDRKLRVQMQSAGNVLAFLSDERYLSFQGRLPAEGGKLTKIISLSRNVTAKRLVETVRASLELPKMPSKSKIELVAKTVSKQRVKLRLEKYPLPWHHWLFVRQRVQFINDTKFPMKIVSGLVGDNNNNLGFVQDVEPYSSYHRRACCWTRAYFSSGGYIIIYNDGNLSSPEEPEGDVRVIEFALSCPYLVGYRKVNIQDKTDSECTKGFDTHKKMISGDSQTVYWVQDGTNYIAVGDVSRFRPFPISDYSIWSFIIQEFDPTKDLEYVC